MVSLVKCVHKYPAFNLTSQTAVAWQALAAFILICWVDRQINHRCPNVSNFLTYMIITLIHLMMTGAFRDFLPLYKTGSSVQMGVSLYKQTVRNPQTISKPQRS